MKQLVVNVCDLIMYVPLAFLIVVVCGMFQKDPNAAIWLALAGFVAWCILTGFWFILSSILDELRAIRAKAEQ